MISIDHELLRCFVAIAETRTFTSAGEKLGLTQPRVSVRVKKLEERLKKSLIVRIKRSVRLTDDGEVLLKYARQMMNLNQEILHYFNASEMSGKLRVGIAEYVAYTTLQPLLKHFRNCYRNVKLEVEIGLGIDLIPKFEAGKLDIVISGIGGSDYPAKQLYEEQLVWCAAPDWTFDPEVPIELLSLPIPCDHRAAGIKGLNEKGLPYEQTYTSTNISSVKAAIAAGLGVAVVPESVVDENLQILTEKDGFPSLPKNWIGAYLLDKNNPLTQVFLDFYIERHLETSS